MPTIQQITKQTFPTQVLNSQVPVLVDFYADWCGPCKTQTPILEAFAKDHDGELDVVKVDVDQDADLARSFGVRSIPTLVLFKNGAPVDTRVGTNSQAQLTELLVNNQ